MRCVVVEEVGDTDVLRLATRPDPRPGPGQAVIAVRAVAVNGIDLRIRAGTSGIDVALPRVLGMEFAGEVVDVATDVDRGWRGRRVAARYLQACRRCERCRAGQPMHCSHLRQRGIDLDGGYAELAVADVESLMVLPPSLPWASACCLQTTYGTAWRGLITHAGLRPGETIVVSAAGGGLGTAATQIAVVTGARVIAVAGGAAKLAAAEHDGAAVVIDHRREDVVARIREATGGRGADVVIDTVGGATFTELAGTVATGGTVVVCGATAGAANLDLVEVFRREVRIVGSARATDAEIDTVVALAGEGRLTPVIEEVLPLDRAGEAHRRLALRTVVGKLVLDPTVGAAPDPLVDPSPTVPT